MRKFNYYEDKKNFVQKYEDRADKINANKASNIIMIIIYILDVYE